MASDIEISAQVSATTRQRMEAYVRETGVEPSHLIEQAVLHHLQALDELPSEYVVHPRLLLSARTGEALLRAADSAEPTPALRDLMRDGD